MVSDLVFTRSKSITSITPWFLEWNRLASEYSQDIVISVKLYLKKTFKNEIFYNIPLHCIGCKELLELITIVNDDRDYITIRLQLYKIIHNNINK